MRVIASTVARATAVTVVALGLGVAAPAGAQAKDKVGVRVSGFSAPTAPAGGVTSFTGHVTGDPFYGLPFTGTFGPDDGTLPVRVPGQPQPCEHASGTLTIGDSTGSLTLDVSGEMCEQFGAYPTFGAWSVVDGDGVFAKAKGRGLFGWTTQWYGTQWSMDGDLVS